MSIHWFKGDIPEETGQYIFLSSIIINIVLNPPLLKKCYSKEKEILNPMINSSYS
jgi:hypothetical protein